VIAPLLRPLVRRWRGNELDRILERAARRGARRFLVFWNRGLGDIALGLYALFARIRQAVPAAEIAVLTRRDLAEAFALFDVQRVIVDPALERGAKDGFAGAAARVGLKAADFDVVLERPDPTRWLAAQLGTVVPRLAWKPEHDALGDRFGLASERAYVGAHVSAETARFYGYPKDWPAEAWRGLFDGIGAERCVLFGHAPAPPFEGCADLRGRTTLLEMLAIVKNRCRVLVAPDSGVLTLAYYLDVAFPLTIVSLWSDPRQGVLKQGVASPNPLLRHVPLVGEGENVRRIPPDEVLRRVREALEPGREALRPGPGAPR
jgi:ADP-heptose:LPS heptosyltransferase